MDALSDVLRVVQLTGAVYLDAAFTAPWCVFGQADATLRATYLPPAERVVSFHLITEGSCWVRLPGEQGSAMEAEAGDLIVVPLGEAHVMGSSAELAPVSVAPMLESQATSAPGELLSLGYGGGGIATRMVCGFLAGQDLSKNPLLSALPRLFKVALRGSQGAWLQSSLRFATEEVAGARAGSATVLAKVSELMFVEALRRYVDTLPDDRKGWLAGLRDRFVGRALALMHARPAQHWTVEALARDVGLSRSALAQRFSELLGMPPMQYLAQWRLQLAAQQMRLGDRPLATIAEAIGYESEAAFNRAFKREFGQPPATWRRHAAAGGSGAAPCANVVLSSDPTPP
jgi:AraC family transcriptional regulator, alkane utilization regulator